MAHMVILLQTSRQWKLGLAVSGEPLGEPQTAQLSSRDGHAPVRKRPVTGRIAGIYCIMALLADGKAAAEINPRNPLPAVRSHPLSKEMKAWKSGSSTSRSRAQ